MNYQELIVLLPCHSLEDFPTYGDDAEAEGLLAACTALWHPALLHVARKIPTWCRADMPPPELAGRLFAVPQVSEGWLACDFLERAQSAGATVVQGMNHRSEIVSTALAKLPDAAPFDADTVADFFALGFCRLHVDLLTRFTRYTSTIDDVRLQSDVLAAIDAAIAGERDAVAKKLGRCFEQLSEARRHFFPVDPYIVDLTLVAETTIGQSLRAELASPMPKNLLVCGKVLEQMAAREPLTVEAIKSSLAQGTASLVGGEHEEREFPLLPEEIWREDLLRGIATYERIVGRRPTVYGRRRAGLSPLLPQLLCRTGFQAALHFTLDDGQFPTSPNAKVRWDSPGGSVVEAIAQVPFDAARNVPFLELSRRLGEAMDRDQVATLVFAHWPATSSMWFEDLRRAARYSCPLGKFVTLEEYFVSTVTATSSANFNSDDYHMPYLQQAVVPGMDSPLSQVASAHIQHITDARRHAIALVAKPLYTDNPRLAEDPFPHRSTHQDSPPPEAVPVSQLLINPHSFAVTCPVNFGSLGREPDSGKPFFRMGTTSATVNVPGMGFAWVTPDTPLKPTKDSNQPVIDGKTIRNEFCEVVISETTGGIQSIHDYRTRGNRISQQLAMRRHEGPASPWRDPDQDAVYSVMVADHVEGLAELGPLATITSRGRLVDREGKRLAGFQQLTWLASGDPVVHFDIVLEVDELPQGDPWNNYYAMRFALPDTDLTFSRNIGLGKHATDARQIEAPLFVEAASSRWRTTILPGGLPYHRRVEGRTLDTLLIVRGESQRSFRFGIAIDPPDPAAVALRCMSPVEVRYIARVPNLPTQSAWLFHIDAKNVVATAWEPLREGGVRVRLRETAGAAGRVCLRSWRRIKTARQTDFLGNTLCELAVEHDKIWMEVKSYEWIQVEASFAS